MGEKALPLKGKVCSQHRKESALEDILDGLVRMSMIKSIKRHLASNLS